MSVKPMRRASPPEGIVGLEELPAVKMRMAPAQDTTMITRVVVAHLFGGTGIQGIIRHMTLLRMIIQSTEMTE
jgi:hypothetical protein